MSPKYTDVIKPVDFSVALLWTNIAPFLLPADASDRQREDVKRAFYAGFTEGFKVLNDYATELDERSAVAFLTKIDAECKEFYELMKKRHGL